MGSMLYCCFLLVLSREYVYCIDRGSIGIILPYSLLRTSKVLRMVSPQYRRISAPCGLGR